MKEGEKKQIKVFKRGLFLSLVMIIGSIYGLACRGNILFYLAALLIGIIQLFSSIYISRGPARRLSMILLILEGIYYAAAGIYMYTAVSQLAILILGTIDCLVILAVIGSSALSLYRKKL